MLGRLGLDEYALTARLAPALAAAAPLALAIGVAVPTVNTLVSATLVSGTAAGLGMLVTQVVRTAGRAAERRLVTSWGALPTTLALRLQGPVVHQDAERRRAQLARLCPTCELLEADAERRDPGEANRRINAAVEWLRTSTRDQQRFYLLHAENRQYGFRRNAFAIRSLALVGSVAGLAASTALIWHRGPSIPAVVWTVAQGLLLAVWFFIPTPRWVRETADRYAEQLLATLDELESAHREAVGSPVTRRIITEAL